MDIKQQIKEYLNKKNASLTSVVNMINAFKSKDEQTTLQNINNKLTRGTIKYSEVLEIAQVLGYDIVWQEQKPNEINLSAFKVEDILNNVNTIQTGTNYEKLKEKPNNTLLEQEVHKFYSNLLILLANYNFQDNLIEYINKNLGVASISFNSVPLYSFIYKYSPFLWEALSYTPYGKDFSSILNYLNTVYFQGGVNTLTQDNKQNLINSLQYFNDKYFNNQEKD
jgi:hypothetical protein